MLWLKIASLGLGVTMILYQEHQRLDGQKEHIEVKVVQSEVQGCILPPKAMHEPALCDTTAAMIISLSTDMAFYRIPQHSEGGKPEPSTEYEANRSSHQAMDYALLLEKIFKKYPKEIPSKDFFDNLRNSEIAPLTPAQIEAFNQIEEAIASRSSKNKTHLSNAVAKWFAHGGFQPKSVQNCGVNSQTKACIP